MHVNRKTYSQLAAEAATRIVEIMPWDLDALRAARPDTLLLDIREREEFSCNHIDGSLNVPRGILESACEWDYPETVPELVEARARPVVVICRSGQRSALAALVMQEMGYTEVRSMRLGVRGWNDADQPLVDASGGQLDGDDAEPLIEGEVRREQMDPARRPA